MSDPESNAEILGKIKVLMQDLFDEYDGPVGPQISAADVQQWDSLANVQFIVLMEQTFGMRFSTSEIEKSQNLGDLIHVISAKRKY